MTVNEAAIGIDLGTRNALCACVDGSGRPVMIPNRWGRAATPSVVGWDGEWVVGEDAARLSLQGSDFVWWDIKRKVASDFRAVCGGKAYTAQELLAPLLRALREDAEVFLGQFVSSCVLAVPACFSFLQREAVTRAAEAAGLRETRVVAEPTAAALAFGREGRFLVLDFGAGTVDISAVESEGGVWQVLESVGSARVGGYDFDLALADWLRERLSLGHLTSQDPRWRTLVLEAESIKIALSSCRTYEWIPPALDKSHSAAENGSDAILPEAVRPETVRIEREDLERMVRFSIRRLVHVARRLWERHEPERLLLVGGSSRIPLLMEILEREIARPERLSLCAEESVAAGAALYTRVGKGRLLLDAVSGDLGLLRDGKPEVLIPAGTPIPFTARTFFVPPRTERAKLSLFQNAGDIQEEGLPGSRTILSMVNLDVVEGVEVEFCCALSASGLMNISARHGNTAVEIPFYLPPGDDKTPAPASPRRRIRELKLRLTPLEPLLPLGQADRLHNLIRRIEGLESEESAAEMLESLVKDLEIALS